MSLDPRTPVLIGAGQFVHRATGLDDALDASALICEAIRSAATDAGLGEVPNPDSVRVVGLLSWKYGDPAWVVANQLGLAPRETAATTMGGNSPQTLVNGTAMEIQRGELDLAILCGGEAWRTRMRARKAGVELDWPTAPVEQTPRLLGEDLEMNHPIERARNIVMPVQVYPMFETAIRAAAGRTVEEQQVLSSELYAKFSEVAAANPYAWIREAKTAEEIRTPSATNRMIGFPYPKYMNSNNDVDMGAALIMCSVEKAEALGVPRDRWVFPHSGADCHEHNYISNRWSFAATPAVELGGRRALELAGVGIDDIEIIDLYSCFPSAVQLGAQSLGISLDRQVTRTGGLAFAGGPWNNYVMHAIATVMNDLRDRPGAKGLVWANGGYATKHSFGVYSTTPPTSFQHAYPQDEIDAMPRRELADREEAQGSATIEAYTVMFSREGRPDTSLAACLLADGRRAWGTSSDDALTTAMCEGEWVGRAVQLDSDGTLFS
ncbi:MAG TPA: acetyl-CoA acetyltransferase [Ilumatobacteraceae bacterium]|nr:acetyl-CoA acetyltransferase [Ilumatobacteraceae bacterium]HRB04991.1 acetyl-CoA acetyltransferase [Ilumatobacteraceae bacterium]